MVLTILEVSQKQAYIFESNKLADNITNSAVIAHILGPEYLAKKLADCPYSNKENLVYSGGGHTVLAFSAENDDIAMENAKKCTNVLTEAIYKEFDGLSVFAKSISCDIDQHPGKKMELLTEELEKKKSRREAAFHHGSFGIEKISRDSMKPVRKGEDSKEKKEVKKQEEAKEKAFSQGYDPAKKFEDLGGSKNDSNFIAVVHIDGNGMGSRVSNLYKKPENQNWDNLRADLFKFSNDIDAQFKKALSRMAERVAKNLKENGEWKEVLSLKDNSFPVRRIITAGDDICFVTEGRLGIECAVAFMEALTEMKNSADGESYSSCAGVAIVHQKYPFYKAYELAEKLCSNAKKFNATIHKEDNGKSISSIDWHIEFGEIGDSLEDIRRNYDALDGSRMELRPYIVKADQEILKQYPAHSYEKFRQLILNMQKKEKMYANGKIKELRGALKEGKDSTKYYLRFNRMEEIVYEAKKEDGLDFSSMFSGTKTEKSAFITDYDGKDHSILFDAIELIDTFLELN